MGQTDVSQPFRWLAYPLAGIIALGTAWSSQAQDAPTLEADPAKPGKLVEDDTSKTHLPGFVLLDAGEDLQDQMNTLDRFIAEAQWAKAFRLLTDLTDDELQRMVRLGQNGRHVLVKTAIQRRLLSLPPDGRQAFRLYFDGQAKELLDQIKNHPLPGSEDQLARMQTLVDRLLVSSVGGEAAGMLGDLYYERGLFDQAQHCWQLALEQGSATGQAALTLQAKRALAIHRAGNLAQAHSLYNGLQARYSQTTIQAGGEDIDALTLLANTLEPFASTPQHIDTPPLTSGLLPKPDATPQWHLTFLSSSEQSRINFNRNINGFYMPPEDLLKFVPPVVADEQRVYFHWLDVVFALDRKTGKIVWQVGAIKNVTSNLARRIHTSQADPRNYHIALDGDTLLVTGVDNPRKQNSPLVVKAYDTSTGQERWRSNKLPNWSITTEDQAQNKHTSVLGEVLVSQGWGYAIVYQAGQDRIFLRRFDPFNGEVDWTLPLGDAETLSFLHTQVRRMPQPQMLMGPRLLYVMTNNGAVLAIDPATREIKWALRVEPPYGIGLTQDLHFQRGNQLGGQLTAMANTNGAGRLLLQEDTLYFKEHNSKALYATDPASGEIRWSADALKPDAKLIGVDDQHFYLMDRALQSYDLNGEHDLISKNGTNTGKPDHAGAILLDSNILLYANASLRQLDTTYLDPAGRYPSPYLGTKGGQLYHFGDLLIAIDRTQITAFKTPAANLP